MMLCPDAQGVDIPSTRLLKSEKGSGFRKKSFCPSLIKLRFNGDMLAYLGRCH